MHSACSDSIPRPTMRKEKEEEQERRQSSWMFSSRACTEPCVHACAAHAPLDAPMTHRPRIHFVLLLESPLSLLRSSSLLLPAVYTSLRVLLLLSAILASASYQRGLFAFDSSFPNNDLRYRSRAPGHAITFDNA